MPVITKAISILPSGRYEEITLTDVGGMVDTPNSIVTGTTSNTFLTSYLIPAYYFPVEGQFKMWIQPEKGGSANGWTIRTYLNTVNSLSGTPLLLSTTTLTNTQLSAGIRRTHTMKGGQMFTYPSTTSAIDDAISAAATTVVNYNTANQIYFIIALQMNGTTDIGSVNSYSIRRG